MSLDFACSQRYERHKGDRKILFVRERSYEILKSVVVLPVGEGWRTARYHWIAARLALDSVRTCNEIDIFLLVTIFQTNHCNNETFTGKTIQSVIQSTYKQLKWKCAKLYWTRWQRSAVELNASGNFCLLWSLCLKFVYSVIRLEMGVTPFKYVFFGLHILLSNSYTFSIWEQFYFFLSQETLPLYFYFGFSYVFCKFPR